MAFVIRIKLNCILNSWSRDFTRHSTVALALTNLCWIIVSVSRAIDPTWQEAARDSQRAPLCAMKYLCCAFIITYRPIRRRLWHETVLGSRGRDVWLRMLPVGRSSGAPGQPLLHKSQTRTSMKSSVFNKGMCGSVSPYGEAFCGTWVCGWIKRHQYAGGVAGSGQTLQTHSRCIWTCWQTEAAFYWGRPVTSKMMVFNISNVTFYLILFSKGAHAFRGSLRLSPPQFCTKCDDRWY